MLNGTEKRKKKTVPGTDSWQVTAAVCLPAMPSGIRATNQGATSAQFLLPVPSMATGQSLRACGLLTSWDLVEKFRLGLRTNRW
jgi:hypothetical protein